MAAWPSHSALVLQQWRHLSQLLDTGSRSVTVDGESLRIADGILIARYGGSCTISSTAYENLTTSVDALSKRLAQGEIIYGVNTGFGANADLRTKATQQLQRALIRELSYGILPVGSRDGPASTQHRSRFGYDESLEVVQESLHLPRTWVRAAILIRVNSLIKGYSAVRPVIVERMQDLLQHDIVPMIPMRGSISASGDLNPLAYIAGVIQGRPSIRVLSKRETGFYADEALAAHGLEPVLLGAKEGLAIVNGTSISAAAGVLALYDAHVLAVLSQVLTGMAVEALLGTKESFHPFFGKSRPHPGQVESASNILTFLEDSKLAVVNDGLDGSLRQDRYSIRTASQWLGPALEDLVLADQQIAVECNSATDNPLFDAEGTALHGGNFQAKSVTAAMEKIRQAMQTIGRMLFCQCTEMINPATSRGLPPNLIGDDPSTSGIFKGTDIHIAALQAELGFLSNPVNHVQTAESGNQALNSLALISARYTHTSIEILSEMAAAHLIAACQAVDLRVLHATFLDSYRAQFSIIVTTIATKYVSSNLSEASCRSLDERLWNELIQSMSSTASMDAGDRFKYISRTLRLPLMDHEVFQSVSDIQTALDEFCSELERSLYQRWCSHRDAYLVHGSASTFLGRGSKALYDFVRATLRVPFLCTARIRTPDLISLTRDSSQPIVAPTVGQYTGVVYRAIRNGSIVQVLLDIMSDRERRA